MKSSVQIGYAKINLHLDVTGILPRGYHSVNTVMQSVSLCDTVTLTKRADDKINISCSVSDVPLGADNLAHKAAMAFRQRAAVCLGADIHIEKRIPMAAGLAGGSADAAAVLRGMNELCGDLLSAEELCDIGSVLGADVPFCIVCGCRFADGKGDLLHPFPSMPDCTVLIACGGEGVSTPMAYGMLDTLYDGFGENSGYVPRELDTLKEACASGDAHRVASAVYNIFESPILSVRPVAAQIKQTMLDCGALGAMMSGSGPSVFGIFEDEQSARLSADKIAQMGVVAHLCRPVDSLL